MSDTFGSFQQRVGTWPAADQSYASWNDSRWWEQLQPGSWRGVGFVMDTVANHAGRRTATHEYPWRDTVWTEDLGKLPRRFVVQAYLTGDDVYQQRDAMLRAAEQPGPGTLVHPTMGTMQVVMIDFTWADRRERGRYIELNMAFVAAGELLYPTAAADSAAEVKEASQELDKASVDAIKEAIPKAKDTVDTTQVIETRGVGSPVLEVIPAGAGSNVRLFCDMVEQAVSDAARPLAAVRGLQGFYGRYASGGLTFAQPPSATVASCLANVTTTRTAVLAANDEVRRLAGML